MSDLVRYSNCWEDGRVLLSALRPSPGKRILSIASAGDNALALLSEGADVVAVDLSRAQLACLELKCAAFRHLDHAGMLAFLGVRPCPDRLETYAKLAQGLSAETLGYWATNLQAVSAGVIHCGKLENYFRLFRGYVIPLVHGRSVVDELLSEKPEAARRSFYQDKWDNRRWRLLFRAFFSRFLQGRLGRDPEFLRHVHGPVAEPLLERAKYALTVLPTHDNPYLDYILTGTFPRSLPLYLRPERFAAVRRGLSRLTVVAGPVQDAARRRDGAGFDGFNLSDIFEYLDPRACREVYSAVLEAAEPGARLAYWNMLVPRRCPDEFKGRTASLDGPARELFARGQAFFYSAFVIEEVRRPGGATRRVDTARSAATACPSPRRSPRSGCRP